MLDLKSKYKINDNIVLRKIDNLCWALNTDNGIQYRLNDVAFFILDCFRETSTVEDMMQAVRNEYAVEEERLKNDLSVMLQTAINKNILKEG